MIERGKFIVFEGGDGSGKSTQTARVVDYLKEMGMNAFLTREPGGVPISEEIRRILLRLPDIVPYSQLLLFYAARVELVKRVISPNLNKGITVVSDRFSPSTFVYQGYVQGVGMDEIKRLDDFLVDVKPDVVVLLDGEPGVLQTRLKSRKGVKTVFDRQALEFHQKVREGFIYLAHQNPELWEIVDASNTEDEVFNDILTILNKRKIPPREVNNVT
ncbi:dTMP kinase [Candidatus Microgenomates bacterium]|nr:dTMP kinase [Candidatus Microgenomates bacterium]